MSRTALDVTLAILFLGMFLTTLPGCASAPAKPPECEDLPVRALRTPGGPVYVFDQDGIRALAERFRQLQQGECRLPAYDRPEA